jgi:cob(I)alamin adenosyltransferase
MSPFYTREGDDGYTGLLGEGRVPKYHLRPQAYGTVDEASASLGQARALAQSKDTQNVLLTVQRDLYQLMSELASTPETAERFRAIDASRVEWLEEQIDIFGQRVDPPDELVVGGDMLASSALDLARTVVRRAERFVTQLQHEGELANPHLLQYLNRLSSLCFVLMLWENKEAGFERPSLAKAKDP